MKLHQLLESQSSPGATLKGIFNMLELKPPRLGDSDYDLDEVLEDTAKLLVLARTAYADARNACFALSTIGSDLAGDTGTRLQELTNSCEALTNPGPALQPWFMEGIEAIKIANRKAMAMRAHATAVASFVDKFQFIIKSIEQGKETKWTPYYKIASAAFKKIGAM